MYRTAQPGIIVSLLNSSVKPLILLGAGASKQSGIRLVTEIVEEIAKWAYCNDNGISIDDPRLTMSDWKKWVAKFNWYTEDYSTLYPIIVEELLNPRQKRKDFFLEITHPDVPASKGYEVLAQLMHWRMIDTVLTTNFDDCLQKASVQIRKPPYIQHIKTPSDFGTISYSPQYPQQIYLHGSVEHYTDQNLRNEIEKLNSDLLSAIKPILKDRPLIVIGYRGAEPSIMNDLFLNHLSYTNNFHQGIYWCMIKREYDKLDTDPNLLTPAFTDLYNKTNGNFHIIPIDGFDELMVNEILGKLQATKIDLKNITVNPDSPSSSVNYETTLVSTNTIGPLEIALLRERITNYCVRLNIKVYQEDHWLYQQLQMLRIAGKVADKYELTFSGILLFSSKTQNYIPQSEVALRFLGKESWLRKVISVTSSVDEIDDESYSSGIIEKKISGNLWSQLNEITEALTYVNKPFRLKGEISEQVFPYPSLALKEIIVNSLVHRDYSIHKPVVIEVKEDSISFVSPGGLIEEVKRQLSDSLIEEEIRKGRRGIKGYRNPVLADIFYGAGAMDKEGSGLADVLTQVNNNAGVVSFSANEIEKFFEVIIYRRYEEIDEQTETATPLLVNQVSKFGANIFEFLKIPNVIYHAYTSAKKKSDISKVLDSSWSPPYLLHRDRIWSFYELSQPLNPLSRAIDMGTLESISVEEFIDVNKGTNEFVRMLNDCLVEHLFSIGLRVDKDRKRAYFTKTMEGEAKEITYQGRFKKATRTVAKPRKNLVTGKIYYWEHKSFWYNINRIGSTWYLCLNPSYVFTTDGVKFLLKSERVSVLSTRRASRDYNQHVHNDLTFWSRYIASSNEEIFMFRPNLKGDNREAFANIITPEIIVSAKLPTISVHDLTVSDEFEPTEIFDMDQIDKELEKLAQEVQDNKDDDGNTN
jgi:predicted HTH transcriptional regulator/NAD-dependent SIR2 family protein deacetylase